MSSAAMTVMLLATSASGVGTRVAVVTTTVSKALSSAALAIPANVAKANGAAVERIDDLRTKFSWFGSRSRHVRAHGD